MNYILFDSDTRVNLLPLVFTRPVSSLRVGIITLKEKWSIRISGSLSVDVAEYLKSKFPTIIEDENILIDSSLIANDNLLKAIKEMQTDTALIIDGKLIAANVSKVNYDQWIEKIKAGEVDMFKNTTEYSGVAVLIGNNTDVFLQNGNEIRADYQILTKDKTSTILHYSNRVLGQNVFIEEGVDIKCATLNCEDGPIYIGKNAKIMEGTLIRGPFALCENSEVKMGAKIYGDTTIGPSCKVGGEVSNTVFIGYSNKGHDGYLGNSVIGEWCNIGADSNTSNLKNTYGEISTWSYSEKKFVSSGQMYFGLVMGDYSKCAINSMFNSGTVVGVNCSIVETGFINKMTPSFSWVVNGDMIKYSFDKAVEVAKTVALRRNISLSDQDVEILRHISEQSDNE
ncbi:MAG: glucose-1-phosphate thymidylyltransferase [Flavobacteriales bacterium]|nr:glucose-1-phosphate thymidylyltransferase [Flavobacteriales bacterium]